MKFVKKKMHEVMVQAAIWLQPECGVSRCIKISHRLLTILGHDVRVTQVVSHNLRPCAPEHIGWAVQKLRKNAPYLELAKSESLRRVVASIRGQIGSRA